MVYLEYPSTLTLYFWLFVEQEIKHQKVIMFPSCSARCLNLFIWHFIDHGTQYETTLLNYIYIVIPIFTGPLFEINWK